MEHAAVSSIGSLRRRGLEAAIVATVLLAGVVSTRGIPRTTDLDPWDESSAMARGLRIDVAGFPSAQDSPLYAGWYRVFAPFAEDRVALYYLAHRATVTLLPVAVAVFLLAAGTDRSVALALSLALLTSPLNGETWPRVGHFATALLLLGSGLALRLERRRQRFLVGSAAGLALAFVRPELFVGCLLLVFVGVVAGWRALASRGALVRRYGRGGLVLGVAALAALGLPAFFGTGERQLVAFGQHYAAYTAEDVGSMERWTLWRDIVARDFGAAASPIEAMRANPRAFAAHVASNVRRLPGLILAALGRTVTDVGSVWVGGLLLGALAWGAVRGRGVRGEVPEARRLEVELGACLLLLPIAAGCSIVYPRDHYLLMVVVPLVAFAAARVFPVGASGARLAAILLGALALGNAWLAEHSGSMPPVDRPRLRMVRALEEIDDGRPLRIVEAEGADGGFCKYLESPCRRLAPEADEWRPSDLLDPDRAVDAIVVSPRIERYPEVTTDPLWPVLRSRPARLGFRRSAIDPRVLLREGPPAARLGASEQPPVSPPG